MSDQPDKQRPTHAAGIVVKLDPHPVFLIVSTSQSRNEWTFPKGHIEAGETSAEAGEREVREEAGVIADTVAPIGTISFAREGAVATVAYFLMRYRALAASHEDRSVRWGDYETTLKSLSFDDARQMLRLAVGHGLLARVRNGGSGSAP